MTPALTRLGGLLTLKACCGGVGVALSAVLAGPDIAQAQPAASAPAPSTSAAPSTNAAPTASAAPSTAPEPVPPPATAPTPSAAPADPAPPANSTPGAPPAGPAPPVTTSAPPAVPVPSDPSTASGAAAAPTITSGAPGDPASAAPSAAAEPAAPAQPPAPVPAPASPMAGDGPASSSAAAPGWAWATPVAPPNDPAQDSAPSTASGRKKSARLPWRGSALSWAHALTTSRVGVGADYISSAHQVYVQSYSLLLNYYLVESEPWTLRAAAAPSADLELTDSALTTERRELWLADLPLSAIGSWLIAKNERAGTASVATGNLTAFLPTSQASWASGYYLTLSPRAGFAQTVPLFGKTAPLLRYMTVAASLRWDHLFSRANTPVDDDFNYPGQDLNGSPLLSDLVSGDRLAPDTYRAQGALIFAQELFGDPLELSLNAFYQSVRLYAVETSTVQLPTGSYTVSPDPAARNAQPLIGVGAELSYVPTPEVALSVGYASSADLDGPSPHVFYTPRALFLASVSLSLDALYLRLAGEAPSEPSFVGARRGGGAL